MTGPRSSASSTLPCAAASCRTGSCGLHTYFGLTRPAVVVYHTSIPLLVVWFLTLTAVYRFRLMDHLLGLADLLGEVEARDDAAPRVHPGAVGHTSPSPQDTQLDLKRVLRHQ